MTDFTFEIYGNWIILEHSVYMWLRLMVMEPITNFGLYDFLSFLEHGNIIERELIYKENCFLGKDRIKNPIYMLDTYCVPGAARSTSQTWSHSVFAAVLWEMRCHLWQWKLRVKGIAKSQMMMTCHIIWFQSAHSFYCAKLSDSVFSPYLVLDQFLKNKIKCSLKARSSLIYLWFLETSLEPVGYWQGMLAGFWNEKGEKEKDEQKKKERTEKGKCRKGEKEGKRVIGQDPTKQEWRT